MLEDESANGTGLHLAPATAPSRLAGAVLAEEAKRRQVQAERSADVVLPDDLLPGVHVEPLSLRETLRAGGLAMMVVIVAIAVVEEFNRQTVSVLGPDIQDTFAITDTKLVGLASFGGVALVLGAVPLGWLADRVSRRLIVVGSLLVASLGLLLVASSANTFQLFWGFTLVGLGAAYNNPVYGSLIADQYPIPGRGRAFALFALATPVGLMIGPFVAGTVSDLAGGAEGWRWVYLTIAAAIVLLAVAASIFLKDPPRGRFEQELVLGELLSEETQEHELPITIATAYQRMKKIRTFWFVCTGLGVLGFALITVPLQLGLLLRDGYGYGAYTRGWILSLAQIPAVVAMIAAGYLYDRAFRDDPERMVRQAGLFIVAFGAILVVGLRFEPIALLIGFYAVAAACTSAALVAVGPIVASVSPYRLRAQAFAIVPVFTFLMGGFFGSLLVGAMSDAHGERTALTVVVPLSATIGGLLFVHGARFLKRDISLAVEDLLEEQAEQRRMRQSPEDVPVLQVRNLDFSYGPVQVLFDVELEVRRGEVVALLGTNGAGKSTLLRAISGLGIPDRGVVRLNGQALTYVEAEVRFQVGVVQLRGGAGTFPDLTVVENLRTSLLACRLETEEVQQRIARVMELFPALASRPGVDARELSGGQQQMLALAMALVHEPEVLLIDELSLGLAPTVLQELLEVVAHLKAEGQTMVIVEQSLNVALAFADRAVFMEKGRVQFEGPAQELLERDDLAKAVFLGGERAGR
jgi:ABC-type branched-subunit amino acid transport system ATPase component/sugar phosphate permease